MLLLLPRAFQSLKKKSRPRRETPQGCAHVPKQVLKIPAEAVAEREGDSVITESEPKLPGGISESRIVLLNVHRALLPFKRFFSQNV